MLKLSRAIGLSDAAEHPVRGNYTNMLFLIRQLFFKATKEFIVNCSVWFVPCMLLFVGTVMFDLQHGYFLSWISVKYQVFFSFSLVLLIDYYLMFMKILYKYIIAQERFVYVIYNQPHIVGLRRFIFIIILFIVHLLPTTKTTGYYISVFIIQRITISNVDTCARITPEFFTHVISCAFPARNIV